MSHHRSSAQGKRSTSRLKRVRLAAASSKERSPNDDRTIPQLAAKLEPNRELPIFKIPVNEKWSKERPEHNPREASSQDISEAHAERTQSH
jgi:hypothetical protein